MSIKVFQMMKKYRKGVESKKYEAELSAPVEAAHDGNPVLSVLNGNGIELTSSRRDFLKLCGYSFAVGALSSCKSRITRAIPYVTAPREMTPGEALWYASSYVNGSDYCSIIVKSRDGRPVKIEGNPLSGVTRGGTNARAQASVLDLYDMSRFRGPLKDGSSVSWQQIDEEITAGLKKTVYDNRSVVLLTPTIYSPSTEEVISGFLSKFPGSEWVKYDAISCSGMLEANRISFGRQVIPDYRFDKADIIVSCRRRFSGYLALSHRVYKTVQLKKGP